MKIRSVINMPIIVGAVATIVLLVTGVPVPVILSTGPLTTFPLWNYFLISLALIGLGAIFSKLRYPGTTDEMYKQLVSTIMDMKDIRIRDERPKISLIIGLVVISTVLLVAPYTLMVFLLGLFLGPVQTALTIALLTVSSSMIFQRANKVQVIVEDVYAKVNQGHQNPFFNTSLDIANFCLTVTQSYLWAAIYLTHGIVAMAALCVLPAAISWGPLLVTAFKAESKG